MAAEKREFEILARENSRMLTVYGRAFLEPRVKRELPIEATTIAELLKNAGYATAHFGKWHVGRADPRVHGFDESDGATSNGGIRIPLFIRGPAARRGAHSSVLVTGVDLVPTVADLAGVAARLPKAVEGGSLKELIGNPTSASVDRRASEIVFHFPHYDKDPLGPVSAIIADNFKLLRVYEDQRYLLFDLSKDIGEQNDLAATLPDKVRQLDARLTKYLASISAELPTARTQPAGGPSPLANPTRGRRDRVTF